MRDPYEVLGIGKDASGADVKRAYRKLAKANHPDQHADDPKAKERFTEIGQAYEILKDKEKRAQYDRGEIDAAGRPRFAGFEAGGSGFGGTGYASEGIDPSVFSDLFRGFAGGRGEGGRRSFHFQSGPGGRFSSSGPEAEDILRSVFSGGARRSTSADAGVRPQRGADAEATVAVTLEQLASGEKPRVTLPTGKTIAVTLPAKVFDGQVIRLKGQGYESAAGPNGDARVTVRLVPHPVFAIDGANLRVDAEVPLDVAVLGGKVTVPTPEGRVRLTVPPRSSSGQVMRVKGRGLPDGSGGRGDVLARLMIVLPDEIDPALEEALKAIRAAA